MSLNVSALKNYLRTCDKAYLVHTGHAATVDYRGLLKRLASGRTTITMPDALAVIELLWMELRKALASGEIVKLPFGSFYLCASGTFDQADQPFVYGDKAHGHDIRLHFRPNRTEEMALAAETEVERGQIYDKQAPVLIRAASASSGEHLTGERGDYLALTGQRLKFDKTREDLGVWYLNGSEHRAARYATVTPGTVIAQVPPELEAGQYRVVVRTSPNGKDLKIATLPELVSIA